jgi:hypothetical protein
MRSNDKSPREKKRKFFDTKNEFFFFLSKKPLGYRLKLHKSSNKENELANNNFLSSRENQTVFASPAQKQIREFSMSDCFCFRSFNLIDRTPCPQL